MEAYSLDLRERVVRACDQRLGTRREIAEWFGVSERWVRILQRRRRETGSIAAKPHGGGRTAKFEGESLERLKGLVDQQPDAKLEELLERSGVDASIMAVQRALKREGYTRKKRRSTPPSRSGPK